MSSVVDLTRLCLVIGLGLLYFIGQGLLVTELLLHRGIEKNSGNVSFLQRIALAILLGFIVNHGVALLFQSLSAGLTTGIILSAIGLWRFAIQISQSQHTIQTNESAVQWLGTIFVCLLYLSIILFEPLTDWDGRSIWFFHAKMIYAAGSFGVSAGWQHPSVIFSHVDYPVLVPGLAAQSAYLVGYWNEYFPKVALLFILIPAIMWLVTFARPTISFTVLILLFPFSLHAALWRGYMDGYLALYFSIAMLLIGRYIEKSEFIDFISGMACLVFVIYLKNEGQLMLVAGACSFIVTALVVMKDKATNLKRIILHWKTLLAVGILCTPFILWEIYKRNWGITNDLGIGSAGSMIRMLTRLTDHSYALILRVTYEHMEDALLILGLLYFASVVLKYPIPQESLFSIITAGIYYFGVFLVYLLTPSDITWHLDTSASRTMLPINGCIFAACFFLLNSLENLMTHSSLSSKPTVPHITET